jgi:hypothetical protein
VPDYYYFNGANECGMGYRETNWSLPRELQVLHARQNVFDGTWEKTPTMGWMFVPLTEYHGGGAAATIEPLDRHLDHYERMLAAHLGAGVQACYRGLRLYDTPRVRDAVRAWVTWYKRHRDVLESDVIHGRRADGRDVDWLVHVNPRLPERALLAAWNPRPEPVARAIPLDLYYAGLGAEDEVVVRFGEGSGPAGPARRLAVDAHGRAEIDLTIPAGGFAWATVARRGEARAPLALPPLPEERHGHRAEVLGDGRILVFGGFLAGDPTEERGGRTAWIFEPARGAWERTGSLSRPMFFHSSAVADGTVYAVGGSLERYDAERGAWDTRIAGDALPRSHGAAAVLGRTLYAIGLQGNAATGLQGSAAIGLDDLRVTPLPPYPDWQQQDHFAFLLPARDRLHLAGGFGGPDFELTARHYAFDPKAGAWEARAPLPAPDALKFAAWAADPDRGRLYVFGMAGNWVYDAAADLWSPLPPPPWRAGRVMPACALRDGYLYVLGGEGPDGAAYGVDVYDTVLGRWLL